MSPDLEAVLALQAEDTIVAKLNEKLRALDSQLVALDAERKQLEDSLARAKATAEQEEKKRRELSIKVEDHKAMQERNLATLDVVRKPKEANAAMAQVDMLKKVLSEEETDLHSLSLRVHDVHHAIDGQQKLLDELDARQMEQREAHAKERKVIEKELAEARAVRDGEGGARIARTSCSSTSAFSAATPRTCSIRCADRHAGAATRRSRCSAATRSPPDARSMCARRAECFCTRRDDACCSPPGRIIFSL